MRILIDTNNLLRCIPRKSTYRWLWDLFLSQKATLCVSTDILEEYAITEDKHFKVLSAIDFPKVVAIGIDQFKAIIDP